MRSMPIFVTGQDLGTIPTGVSPQSVGFAGPDKKHSTWWAAVPFTRPR